MLEITELRNLSLAELEEKQNQLKKDLMKYRFQAKTGKLERQSTLRDVKRDIARVLTVMNEQKKALPAGRPTQKKIEVKS